MIDLISELFDSKEKQIQAEKDKFQDARSLDIEVRMRELEKRHEQLKLVTLSLWSLLRDHSGLLESDLRRYVQEIDLLDGKRDGKVHHKKEKIDCTGCGRVQLSNAIVCAYCGGSLNQRNPFAGA